MLDGNTLINIEMHVDANRTVLELTLTLDGEVEGLTQDMLNAYAEQFIGKTLPVTLRADADETTAEASIVEELENQPEISRKLIFELNYLAQ